MGLPELPPTFAATRDALHRAAEDVLKPAREQATGGEISLRALPGGFGAPALPGGTWAHVAGTDVVRDDARTPIDGADPDAAAVLARVFAFATALLDTLRDEAADGDAPTVTRLWPEHFDVAIEMGDEDAGQRANYGVSPGDESHPEPYVYVGPWTAPPEDPDVWNADGFPGAELPYAQLRAAEDPHALALAFLGERRDALRAG